MSETSQAEDRISTAFLFQSSLSMLLPRTRAFCFFDHLVTVTRSSMGTSLISALEEGILWNSTSGRIDGVEGEKDDCLIGDEEGLASGLI